LVAAPRQFACFSAWLFGH